MPMKFEIYTSNRCSWAIRNFAALLEKAVSFELMQAYDGRGNKRQEFLDLTPYGKTPIIRHGEVVVYNTLLINEYIDDTFAGSSLMPSSPAMRAEAKMWMHYCDDELIPSLSRVFRLNEIEGEAVEQAVSAFAYFANKVEIRTDRLTPYYFGCEIGLIDLAFYTFFSLISTEPAVMRKMIQGKPRVRDWMEAIRNRESIVKAAIIFAEAPSEPEGETPGGI